MKKQYGLLITIVILLIVFFASCGGETTTQAPKAPALTDFKVVQPEPLTPTQTTLEMLQEMFEGEFYITDVVNVDAGQVVFTAFWEDRLSVYDYDYLSDSAIERFHIIVGPEESEFKTLTRTRDGYAVTTNLRILFLDEAFRQTRELAIPPALRQEAYDLRVSPSGKLVCYCTQQGLFLSDLNLNRPVLLVKAEDYVLTAQQTLGNPRFSEDGQTVTYQIDGDRQGTGTIRIDGSEHHTFLSDPDNTINT